MGSVKKIGRPRARGGPKERYSVRLSARNVEFLKKWHPSGQLSPAVEALVFEKRRSMKGDGRIE